MQGLPPPKAESASLGGCRECPTCANARAGGQDRQQARCGPCALNPGAIRCRVGISQILRMVAWMAYRILLSLSSPQAPEALGVQESYLH